MKTHSPLLFLVIFAGCSKPDVPLVMPEAGRVYTVNEFLAQPDLRKRTNAICNDDPGRLAQDPNCINARRAGRIAGAGSMGEAPQLSP